MVSSTPSAVHIAHVQFEHTLLWKRDGWLLEHWNRVLQHAGVQFCDGYAPRAVML